MKHKIQTHNKKEIIYVAHSGWFWCSMSRHTKSQNNANRCLCYTNKQRTRTTTEKYFTNKVMKDGLTTEYAGWSRNWRKIVAALVLMCRRPRWIAEKNSWIAEERIQSLTKNWKRLPPATWCWWMNSLPFCSCYHTQFHISLDFLLFRTFFVVPIAVYSIKRPCRLHFFQIDRFECFFPCNNWQFDQMTCLSIWSNNQPKKSRESLWKEQLFKHFSLRSCSFSMAVSVYVDTVHLLRTHRCLFNYHLRWKTQLFQLFLFLIFVYSLRNMNMHLFAAPSYYNIH